MALTHVWITRGPLAGHKLLMTEADAEIAKKANWAADHEIGGPTTDEELKAIQEADVDWASYDAYRTKTDDPTYSPQGEDDGSWVPGDTKPPEPPPVYIDNTLPDIPDPEKPPPGSGGGPLGESLSAGKQSKGKSHKHGPDWIITVDDNKP